MLPRIGGQLVTVRESKVFAKQMHIYNKVNLQLCGVRENQKEKDI